MKKVLILSLLVFLVSCKKKEYNAMKMYGNTFIAIKSDKFNVPSDWIKHEMMDGACSIMMPPYMKRTILDGVYIIDKNMGTNFCFCDTIDWKKHYYSRISVDYIKASHGTFAQPDEWVLNSENILALDKIVDNETQNKKLIINYCCPLKLFERFKS